jgi:hypothetical protein
MSVFYTSIIVIPKDVSQRVKRILFSLFYSLRRGGLHDAGEEGRTFEETHDGEEEGDGVGEPARGGGI